VAQAEKRTRRPRTPMRSTRLPPPPSIGSPRRTALYIVVTWDLVDKMKKDPKFDIKSLKDEELCDELKKLKPEEREAYVKKKAAEREELRKKIDDLNAKRNACIQDEMKKQPKSAGDKTFDEALRSTIREQAAAKGLKIPE